MDIREPDRTELAERLADGPRLGEMLGSGLRLWWRSSPGLFLLAGLASLPRLGWVQALRDGVLEPGWIVVHLVDAAVASVAVAAVVGPLTVRAFSAAPVRWGRSVARSVPRMDRMFETCFLAQLTLFPVFAVARTSLLVEVLGRDAWMMKGAVCALVTLAVLLLLWNRWLLAPGLAFRGEGSSVQAMRRSWRRTGPLALSMAGLQLLLAAWLSVPRFFWAVWSLSDQVDYPPRWLLLALDALVLSVFGAVLVAVDSAVARRLEGVNARAAASVFD